jgi:porin
VTGFLVRRLTRVRNPLSWVTVCAAAICLTAVFPSASRAQDWPAVKDRLEQKGITPSIIYEGDVFSNVAGGARRGSTYVGNLYLELALDGQRLINAQGLTAFISGLGTHGGQPGAFAGDAQGVSDMSAPTDFRLYEAWVQQNSFDNRFSFLVGQYDLNTEFYRLTSSGLFLNSSFGIGPELGHSGVAGPSIFPSTSVGFRAEYKPAPNIVLRTAVLDGAPIDRPDGSVGLFKSNDGLLIVSEAAFLDRPESNERQQNVRFRVGRASGAAAYNDKLAFGGWYYTATFNDLSALDARGNPVRRQGNGGAYVLMERALWHAQGDPKRRLAGFVEMGMSDDRVNRFGSYIGSGLVATGAFPNRPIDELGFAFAMANNGSHYLNAQQVQGVPASRSEVAFELAYLAQITHSFAIQPDIQYVMHPNTDPSLKSALVLQLRFEVSF